VNKIRGKVTMGFTICGVENITNENVKKEIETYLKENHNINTNVSYVSVEVHDVVKG
jgi:hypothetical protein